MELLKESFRWYGSYVPLSYIAQSGASGVFTSLQDIKYGEVWTKEKIEEHKRLLSPYKLDWDVVESLPVSEDIKLRSGDYRRHIENFKESIRNLSECGIRRIIYNFMPVFDSIRTDMGYEMPDGSKCSRFDISRFAAFDVFLLRRKGAEKDYPKDILDTAKKFIGSLDANGRHDFEKSIIDGFHGCKTGLEIVDVENMLSKYDGFDAARLKKNLYLFLDEVLPVAEEYSSILAIHPDDPPFGVFGLPRIASNLKDFEELFCRCRSVANTLCFCTGSLGASAHNDLERIVKRLRRKICVAHLCNTQIISDGGFYEAGHLEGGVPMLKIVAELLDEQRGRLSRGEGKIVFSPEHGCIMADDLLKAAPENSGYSYIGMMKGLAELRGLQTACAAFMQKNWDESKIRGGKTL